jgi:hypothetical protein
MSLAERPLTLAPLAERDPERAEHDTERADALHRDAMRGGGALLLQVLSHCRDHGYLEYHDDGSYEAALRLLGLIEFSPGERLLTNLGYAVLALLERRGPQPVAVRPPRLPQAPEPENPEQFAAQVATWWKATRPGTDLSAFVCAHGVSLYAVVQVLNREGWDPKIRPSREALGE